MDNRKQAWNQGSRTKEPKGRLRNQGHTYLMAKGYVYEIRSSVDDAVYIGKTDNPEGRWIDHCAMATKPLYKAMREHGLEAFQMVVVEEHPDTQTALKAEEELLRRYVDAGRPVYNVKGTSATECGVRSEVKRGPEGQLSFSWPKSPRSLHWNGRVYWSPAKKTWMAKYIDAAGAWKNKVIPCAIVEETEALRWFTDWISAQREAA